MRHNRRAFLAGAAAGVIGAGLSPLRGAEGTSAGIGLTSLTGSARDVGAEFGRLNAADIRQHVGDIYAQWRKQGLTEAQAVERSQPFVRFAEKFGPHWLEEARFCAEAAGTPYEQYVAYLAGKYRSLFFTDDCTSFAAAGEATADGAAIFHKNRDNATRSQSAFYKRVAAPDVAGFYGTGDTSDLGLMMMVNDRGLAGSADTGGLKETRPKGRGVMNPYILRLIAERAERCEDALEIIQQMIKDGWYAGGATTGTHWLFADRFGTILRVAQNSFEEQHWFHRDTVVFLARGGTPAATKLAAAKKRLTVRQFHEAACSQDICFGSSISALTVRIDPERAIAGGTVWFALPAWAPFLPMHTPAAAVPTPVADGECFESGHRLLNLRLGRGATSFGNRLAFAGDFETRRRELQDELYAESLRVESQLRAMLGQEGRAAAAQQLAAEASLKAWRQYQEWSQRFSA